jgi:DNA/RNA endonuclease YhcR with UshA esterase domain
MFESVSVLVAVVLDDASGTINFIAFRPPQRQVMLGIYITYRAIDNGSW